MDEPVDLTFPEAPSQPPADPPGRGRPAWVTALTGPHAVDALLVLGGALTIAGGLVWLASLGVFENPRVVAASLIGGSAAALVAGWVTATRTRYVVAGKAVAALACVGLPLNLWFLHAQDLVTVGENLWSYAAGCVILHAATVWLLRDGRFLLAVLAGVTLTALLAVGEAGEIGNVVWIAGTLAAVGLAGVAATAAFPREPAEFDPETGEANPLFPFARSPFAVPLLWGGAALLLAGGAGLGAAELRPALPLVGWLLPALPPGTSRLTVAGVWAVTCAGLILARLLRPATQDANSDEPVPARWIDLLPGFAAVAGGGAVANLLVAAGTPGVVIPAVFALCGIGLMAVGRWLGVRLRTRPADGRAFAVGRGAATLRVGFLVLAGVAGVALWRAGVAALLPATPPLREALGGAAVALLLLVGAALNVERWAKITHGALAALVALAAGAVFWRIAQISGPRLLEIAAVCVGLAALAAAVRGRAFELAGREQRGDDSAVPLGLWLGSLLVIGPLAIACGLGRWAFGRWASAGVPWVGDELLLAAGACGLVLTGVSLKARGPALCGAGGLGVLAVIVAAAVFGRPQFGLGVGLTAGGATLFAAGLLLSVCRDRLAVLADRWRAAEGVFAVRGWR